MASLRDRLRETEPELYEAFLRSWQIAYDEWLPAIAPSLDSFNSYPHLRNLERYLEHVVSEYDALHGPSVRPLLTSVEIYIMLAAVLFHDIGRIVRGNGHGEESQKLIKADYDRLGIASLGLAEVIGRVVGFHDCRPEESDRLLLSELGTISVSPYGEIRQRLCAALLLLIDHMDGAFNRVLPVFIRNEPGVVGSLRRAIRGVVLDLPGQMVKVVLSDDLRKKNSESLLETVGENLTFTLCPESIRRDKVIEEKGRLGSKVTSDDKLTQVALDYLEKFPADSFHGDSGVSFSYSEGTRAEINAWLKECPPVLCRPYSNVVEGEDSKGERPLLLRSELGFKDPPSQLFSLLGGGLLRVSRSGHQGTPTRASLAQGADQWTNPPVSDQNPSRLTQHWRSQVRAQEESPQEERPWPAELRLAIVLSDSRANAEALHLVKTVLAANGLPVRGWLIEFEEHLYDHFGKETCEPNLHTEYLKRVAQAMWKLSVTVFASHLFSFETLAAELRDPDVERVRRAVMRLAIIARSESSLPFLVGQEQWRWVIKPRSEQGKDGCKYMSLGEIEEKVRGINHE